MRTKLITSTIESAQKKLEASNFGIRKQVLQYDDVMNQQREIIYKQRQMVLNGEDISGKLHEMMRQSIDDACANYLNGDTADDWDFAGLRRHFMNWLCLPTDFNYTTEQLADVTREGIADELYNRRHGDPDREGSQVRRAHDARAGTHLPAAQRRQQVDGTHRQHGPAQAGHGPCAGTASTTQWWSTASRALRCLTRWSLPSARTPCTCC